MSIEARLKKLEDSTCEGNHNLRVEINVCPDDDSSCKYFDNDVEISEEQHGKLSRKQGNGNIIITANIIGDAEEFYYKPKQYTAPATDEEEIQQDLEEECLEVENVINEVEEDMVIDESVPEPEPIDVNERLGNDKTNVNPRPVKKFKGFNRFRR